MERTRKRKKRTRKVEEDEDLFFSVSTIGSRKLSTNSDECWVGGVTTGLV